MSVAPVRSRSRRLGKQKTKASWNMPVISRRLSRRMLLAGTSALALAMGAPNAYAITVGGSSGTATAAPTVATDAALAAIQKAQQAAQSAQQSMARATRALQSMQSIQAAARAAAQARQTSVTAPVTVANGLGVGGLDPNLPAGWTGANSPTQAPGTNNVNIKQTAAQAILNWKTFNIGAQTTLTFDQQGNASWVALNRVDASTGPSQILGNIKADGQVYVINQNGIIFGGGSQINVGSLIASTANIADQQFLTKGIFSDQSGGIYVPSFTGAGGKVIVEEGALITTNAPVSVTSGGGFVLLMGTEVDNAGSISTPKGQTVMAAGDDFILRRGFGTTANQTSTTRGLEIAPVIHVGSASGRVVNSGLVFAQQGDITLAGHAIVQDGSLMSTTSVNQRGTIHLLNSAIDATGSVTLTGNSVSLILPELDATDVALNSQRDALIADSATQNAARSLLNLGQFDNLSKLTDREDQSRVEIVTGGDVVFKGGSLSIAQGGQVAVSAERIFAEAGSTLDVSGVQNVALAMSSNEIKVNIQGNELRDSPANRDSGKLNNTNVWVDVRDLILVPAGTGGYATDRYYTPGGLLEVSGYLNTTAHTIGEWTAVGGTITLSASEVVAQQGSIFNLSGGSLQYQSGWLSQSGLIASNGRIYGINNAPGDLTYVAATNGFVVNHERAGIVEVYNNQLGGNKGAHWEDGYTVGRDAGKLILSTPTSVFAGDIVADVITGERQTSKRPAGVTDGYKLSQNTAAIAGSLVLGAPQYDLPINSAVTFSNAAPPADSIGTSWFNADQINSFGLGGITVVSSNAIAVNDALTLANGGELSLSGRTVDIAAKVTARGGGIFLGSTIHQVTTAITLRSGAVLDTRGLWTNAALDPANLAGLAFLNGGSVTLQSIGNVTMEQGSLIDASSGAAIMRNGKTVGGAGGDIALIARYTGGGLYPGEGYLKLDGRIRSYGFTRGGALTIQTSGNVIIGDQNGSIPGSVSIAPGVMKIAPEFFTAGFSKYSVNGIGGLTVADGAHINVAMPLLQFTGASFGAPTGSDPTRAVALTLDPLYVEDPIHGTLTQRPGADLILLSGVNANTQNSAMGGSVTIGTGAEIAVDPGHSIKIASGGQITIDGRITAHGGDISIVNNRSIGGGSPPNWPNDPGGLSIWIDKHAVLDVSTQAATARDLRGRRYGVVANAGSITLGSFGGTDPVTLNTYAADAFIVVRPGAVLSADGTSAVIDLNAAGGDVSSHTVASNGGTVAMRSYYGIYNDGAVHARAGGAGAAGGTLSLVLESPVYGVDQTLVPANLQSGRVLVVGNAYVPSGLSGMLRPSQADPSLAIGQARISARQIEDGGFDNVSLWGRTAIMFEGDVSLHAGQSISLLQGGIYNSVAGGNVTLSAPYLFLGGQTKINPPPHTLSTYLPNVFVVPPAGGRFSATAGLIDVQNIVGTSFANTALTSRGDIRFLAGTDASVPQTILAASGNLELAAQQLYPTTNALVSVYAGVASLDSTNSPTFTPGGILTVRSVDGVHPGVPYSVFGQITLAASEVRQGGIVRAPLGSISLGVRSGIPSRTELLPGSVTSVSANGLVMPYGGTLDGVTYTVDGGVPVTPDLYSGSLRSGASLSTGIYLNGVHVTSHVGSHLDLSGGGILTGAGFVSGRGGSVDVLLTALANANPANAAFSAAGNQVYAIVPGVTLAPVAGGYNVAWTGNVPGIGQQIDIPAGVPGLPAGTYTLLPANYALLPGAFRVELGGHTATQMPGAVSLPNGSYVTSGFQGIAHTLIKDALATSIVVTPGATVRSYSQYNEQGYDAFQLAQAKLFHAARPLLPQDGKFLTINLNPLASGSAPTLDPALIFNGGVDFTSLLGGYGGSLVLTFTGGLAITGPDSATQRTDRLTTVAGSTLDAIAAPNLYVGAGPTVWGNATSNTPGVTFRNDTGSTIEVEHGVTLTGSQVVLVASSGGTITLDSGARINTLGGGTSAPDSSLTGYLFGNQGGTPAEFGAMLIASNGDIALGAPSGHSSGSIVIQDGASIYAKGTIGFDVDKGVNFEGRPQLGARSLAFALPSINIGDAAALTAASRAGTLPSGLNLDQVFLDSLLAGDRTLGAPAVQNLILSASQSINFYGSVALNTRDLANGRSDLKQFVLNSPAIYGYGTASDVVKVTADTLVWNGTLLPVVKTGLPGASYVSAKPGAVIANGPGTGTGTFNVDANRIVFGYPDRSQPNNSITFDRLMLGFSTLNLNATDRITANNEGTLSFYTSAQQDPSAGFNPKAFVGTGGNLNFNTPLLTTDPGAVISFYAGGAANVAPLAGAIASSAIPSALGGEIRLSANSIAVSSAVVLPSGKLTMTAVNDITLADGSRLDLSGQAVKFFDVTKYSWGGDVVLESTHGNIVQQAGSVIDVSAAHNDAGTLKLTATDSGAGRVLLGGTLRGKGSAGYRNGSIDLRAQLIGANAAGLSNDFALLNTALNAAGFFDARSFDLKQGSLTIGNEVIAHRVGISIDNGTLTVNGTIDASGKMPGTIRLASRGNLTLNGTLDAHGTTLQVDGYGQPIEARNRGHIELTTTEGILSLATGSTMDLRVTDPANSDAATGQPVSYGEIVLNAPRIGASSGVSATGAGAPANATATDIAVWAAGPLDIRGARSIALNGFATYTNAPANPNDANGQIIDQTYLGLIDQDSQAFINGALTNNALLGRLAGLLAYEAIGKQVFHLRPGVAIDSKSANGNLTIAGDLDLSSYRYGPKADRNSVSPTYGAGEPMALIIRAGGNLNVNGSINDGFATPPGTPDDRGFLILAAGTLTTDKKFSEAITLAIGTSFVQGSVLPFDLALPGTQVLSGGPEYTSDVVVPDVPAGYVLFAGTDPRTGAVLDVVRVVQGQIDDPNYSGVTYYAGDYIEYGALGSGAIIHAGTILSATNMADTTIILSQGPMIAANVPIPQSVTLALSYTLIKDVVATATIITPTRTYTPGMTVPSGTILSPGTSLSAGVVLPFDVAIQSTTWRAGSALAFVGGYSLTSPQTLAAGQVVPADTTIATDILSATARKIWAVSPMLASGTMSASMRLVAGADLAAADTRTLQSASLLVGAGNLTLDDPHEIVSNSMLKVFSVLRTGTGDLDLLAGGNFAQRSLYGIYTAGTQTIAPSGVVATANTYYPDHGGDLLIAAQGNLSSARDMVSKVPFFADIGSDNVANWLVRDSGPDGTGTWSIRFGAYDTTLPGVLGFVGFGTLGGGNVALLADGDAGVIQSGTDSGLVVAVGSTGLVTSVAKQAAVVTGGTLVQTGGGDITVKIGGHLNPGSVGSSANDPNGSFTDTRGNLVVDAGAIGHLPLVYGASQLNDPRAVDPYKAASVLRMAWGGPIVVPGDGTVMMRARGDLVLGGVGDAGTITNGHSTNTLFSLWRQSTAISLFSAGGNLTPNNDSSYGSGNVRDISGPGGANIALMPPTFEAVAASGSIYSVSSRSTFELAPSPSGQLQLLAYDSIYGAAGGSNSLASRWDMSGMNADANSIPNPFKAGVDGGGLGFFQFAGDTVTHILHAGDSVPIRLYAATSDITNFLLGQQASVYDYSTGQYVQTNVAAKAAQVRAGRDIVNFGFAYDTYGTPVSPSLIMNNNTTDVSVISAGRDIVYANVQVAGPGSLEVVAGRNLYQADRSSIVSLGALASGDNRPGASIAITAGAGAAGPNYAALAARYLDPANLAATGTPLAAQPGKVARTYEKKLLAWLKARFGYDATSDQDGRAYFAGLAPEQQRIFLREVYFAELTAAGREYNDRNSSRYGSYLRGRDVIATLFPDQGVDGTPIAYQGDITMFGASGVQTLFGGGIQMLTPGGKQVIGVEGVVPPSTSGLITQGSGDIQLYSKGSILLGLSRIMTTFGGNILAWSAEGDINAGRGAKTSVLYTPPKRIYDNYGNVTLAPVVPSSGAGIATLNPIPEIPPGSIDLIAPLGTIDAGEAGIRSSGDINIVANLVLNAANIQVQGNSTGVPTVQGPPVAALTTAANNTAATQQSSLPSQSNNNGQSSVMIVEIIGYGGGQETDENDNDERRRRRQ